MAMTKAKRDSTKESASPKTKFSHAPLISDESILDSFDPVVEGASFQILEEGIDLSEFSRVSNEADETSVPEVLETFDLSESLSRIPDKLFFRIGDAAELLDVKPYVLRFWETEFPMVRPTKSRSGQRVYRKKDVEMLLLIKHLLYVERFSIEGARKRIRELKLKPGGVMTRLRWKGEESKVASAAQAAYRGAIDSSKVRETLDAAKTLASADLSKFFRF